jgi:hypothetical protein
MDGIRDHTGIAVYVPGTSYQARTDAAGNFLMTFIPAGTWSLRFERDGFISVDLIAIEVKDGETSKLDPVTLKLSGGTTGFAVVQKGEPGKSQSRTVDFSIVPGSADRFKAGLQADLESLPY